MPFAFSLSVQTDKNLCISHGAVPEVSSVHVGCVNSQEGKNGWVKQLRGMQMEGGRGLM